MHKFKDLCIGDMFNTKVSRYVKISETEAIDVFHRVGRIVSFDLDPEFKVIVLYSAILRVK